MLKGYDQLLNLVLDDVEEDVEREELFPIGPIDLCTDFCQYYNPGSAHWDLPYYVDPQ